MLTSEDLRFFCVVAINPSLAATARSLNVTPPSVTQRLKNIEDKLQLKLINRQARSIVLTDEGQLLFERAKFILAEMDALHEAIYNQRDDVVGRLKILAPLGFGNEYIAPLAAQFQCQHQNLSVEVELSENPEIGKRQSADIIIHIGELRDSSLKMSLLAQNKRFICASPAYIAQHGQPKSIAELRYHACIALRENAEDVTMWRFTKIKPGDTESVRIIPKLASNDGRVVKQWALSGYGIIIRSQWDVAKELSDGRLVRILENYELPSADIVALLSSEQQNRSARTIKFLAFLKEKLTPSPWNTIS